MFCDICDQFDLHDTEDCPRQAQDSPEPEISPRTPKKLPAERPYCEICEGESSSRILLDMILTFDESFVFSVWTRYRKLRRRRNFLTIPIWVRFAILLPKKIVWLNFQSIFL